MCKIEQKMDAWMVILYCLIIAILYIFISSYISIGNMTTDEIELRNSTLVESYVEKEWDEDSKLRFEGEKKKLINRIEKWVWNMYNCLDLRILKKEWVDIVFYKNKTFKSNCEILSIKTQTWTIKK